MKIQLKLKHILVALFLGVVTWKAIPVIDYFTGKTIDWKQEAPLHDGRMLIVDRRSELSPSDPFQLSVRFEVAQALTFTHPDTGERISLNIPKGLLPVMIDFDRGSFYFVLLATDYSGWGCPNPPYLVYRYQQGKWKHVAFEELPASLENRNLIAQSKSVYSGVNVLPDGSYVPAAVMEKYWKEFRDSAGQSLGTRRLSREKINPIAEGCYASVLEALGREAEMDEKSRQRSQDQLANMPDTARREHPKNLAKIKKEIQEKLK